MSEEEKRLEVKERMHYILNEIPRLKKYNEQLANNVYDVKLEELIEEMRNNIIKFQNEVENTYFSVSTVKDFDNE